MSLLDDENITARTEFAKDIAEVLIKHGVDRTSHMPPLLISNYISRNIIALLKVVQATKEFKELQ